MKQTDWEDFKLRGKYKKIEGSKSYKLQVTSKGNIRRQESNLLRKNTLKEERQKDRKTER